MLVCGSSSSSDESSEHVANEYGGDEIDDAVARVTETREIKNIAAGGPLISSRPGPTRVSLAPPPPIKKQRFLDGYLLQKPIPVEEVKTAKKKKRKETEMVDPVAIDEKPAKKKRRTSSVPVQTRLLQFPGQSFCLVNGSLWCAACRCSIDNEKSTIKKFATILLIHD